jgi:hypothetical protein
MGACCDALVMKVRCGALGAKETLESATTRVFCLG